MAYDNIDFQIVTESLAHGLEEKVRVVESLVPSWNFIIIFSAVLIFVLNKQFAPKRLRLFASMFYQNLDTEKMTREWNPLTSLMGFSVAIAYIALLTLFIQKSLVIYTGNVEFYNDPVFYMEICLYVSAFILVRYLFVNATGWIFNTQVASQRQAIVHLSMMLTMTGFFVLHMLVMVFYPIKSCAIAGLVVILFFSAFRIIKTFIEFQFLIKNEIIKIFLYFCTLEIIPISVAVTMVFRFAATNSVL